MLPGHDYGDEGWSVSSVWRICNDRHRGDLMSSRRTTGQARLWAGGIGMAAAAAAMIGMGTAHADTADEVLGQADEAGDLTGAQTSSLAGELTEIQAIYAPIVAEFGTIPGTLDVGFADIFAQFASDIGLSF